VERLFLEILGRPGGVCGGRGGSQHLQFRNFYSNGVQGGIVPVTAGMALAEKLKGSPAVSLAFLGDGTLGEGAVYEAFNIASLWRLPIVFVIEHNGYAQSTPASLQIAGEVAARPRAFGIATEECESTATADVLACAARAIDAVRNTGGPRCCVFYPTRLGPHSKGDDTRSADEMKAAWAFDPLKAARAALDPAVAEQLDRQAAELMTALRARAAEHT
jgi:TPP-dependent pyruvate/acetoin dehydrogenase alpha subunit